MERFAEMSKQIKSVRFGYYHTHISSILLRQLRNRTTRNIIPYSDGSFALLEISRCSSSNTCQNQAGRDYALRLEYAAVDSKWMHTVQHKSFRPAKRKCFVFAKRKLRVLLN